MQLAYPQNDTRAETLRYLGAGGWQPDAASQVLLQKAEDALRAAATPRGVWKQLPLTALPLQNAGNDIARHLRGCDAMVLMAVTLGSGADTLMRRLELTDIALAAVVDAMASAVMEELCNALEAEIRTSVQAQGQSIDYGRLGDAVADSFQRRGMGRTVVQMDKRIVGESVEPSVSRATQQRANRSVAGRSARMVLA